VKSVTIGKARLFLADSYAALPEILEQFGLTAAETVCVMDPQYEFDTSGGGAFRKARDYVDRIAEKGLDKGFDIGVLDRKPGDPDAGTWCDSAFVFCHDNQGPDLWAALRARFQNAQFCGWLKDNPPPVFNKNYLPDLEIYFHAWNRNAAPVGDYRSLSRIKRGPIVKNDYGHPTVKPLHLMRAVMANACGPAEGGKGDRPPAAPEARGNTITTIVDPFMGTGSTGVAALEAGRAFIGIERDPKWFQVAVKRLRHAEKWREPAAGIKAPGKDDPSTEMAENRALFGDVQGNDESEAV
jgi:hypothetical protein